MQRCWSFPARRDGVVLIDAGAHDDEHLDGLVDFITSVFARPELYSTLDPIGCVDCDKGTPSNN